MVEVRLYGRLRRFAEVSDVSAESIAHVPLHGSTTVRDLLRRMGIDSEGEVSNIFVNGRYIGRNREAVVRSGDRVGVFPRDMGLLYC